MDGWHTVQDFSRLSGLSIGRSSHVLSDAFLNKKEWKGFVLKVCKVKGIGKSGFSYKVNPESYPPHLLIKWHREKNKNKPIVKDEKQEIDHESRWNHYGFNVTNNNKEKAEFRFKAVYAYFELIEGPTPCKKGVALVHTAQVFDIPESTLRRWIDSVKDLPRADWLPALAPDWNPVKNTAECTPAAWEFFKGDYLRLEKPTVKACYIRLRDKATAEGWVIPSVDTFERWVGDKGRITVATKVFLREGEQGLMRLYPHQERDKSPLRAMEWINGDGYQHNIFVRFPDGTIARPKTWFWQDVRTNFILGYRVDLSENSDMIRLAFKSVADKYGIPEHVTIDNTRAAANKWMTGGIANRFRFKVKEDEPLGIFTQLGIKVHWTSIHGGKGHGQAKPIERSFGIGGIGELVDKHPAFSGAYTGNKPEAKPENYGSRAVDLGEFLKVLEYGVYQWSNEPNRRSDICRNQLSYAQAFNESYREDVIKKLTATQKHMLLLMAEKVKVGQGGTVSLEAGKGFGMGANRYGCDELIRHIGNAIVVKFDPQDLHGIVHCYDLNGHYIGEAVCLLKAGFGDKEAGREHNKARKQAIKAQKEQAKAESKMSALEIAAQLPEHEEIEKPETKIVMPKFNGKTNGRRKDFEENDHYLDKALAPHVAEFRQRAEYR